MGAHDHHGHDHDHAACRASALARAEERCAETGARLTPIRRQVLAALLADHKPVGAYDVIDRLAAEGQERPAPITVYRALDFLVALGVFPGVERRNASRACAHTLGPNEPLVLLVCETCVEASELSTSAIAETIAAAAGRLGFAVRQPVIEVFGRCAKCGGARGRAVDFRAMRPKPLAVQGG